MLKNKVKNSFFEVRFKENVDEFLPERQEMMSNMANIYNMYIEKRKRANIRKRKKKQQYSKYNIKSIYNFWCSFIWTSHFVVVIYTK